jgi:hypothetical protein
MQDWPLEVADPARLPELCDFYETEPLDRETRFSLMQLIVFSLDDAAEMELDGISEIEKSEIEKRVETLLRRDFELHFHTVDYWRRHDEIALDSLLENHRTFAITPMMRRIWNDCFKPEYHRWLRE